MNEFTNDELITLEALARRERRKYHRNEEGVSDEVRAQALDHLDPLIDKLTAARYERA